MFYTFGLGRKRAQLQRGYLLAGEGSRAAAVPGTEFLQDFFLFYLIMVETATSGLQEQEKQLSRGVVETLSEGGDLSVEFPLQNKLLGGLVKVFGIFSNILYS